MAMNTTPDNGGEDQYRELGPLDQLPPSFAEDDKVLAELTPEAPPHDVAPETLADDERVMNELSTPLAMPRPTMLDEVKSVTSEPAPEPAKPQKGRVYVPPQERTRANRDERRAAVQQARAAQSPNLGGFFESGGQLPDFSEGQSENPQVALMEAGYRLSDSLTHAVVDMTRRVNMLTEALERARL